MGLHRQADDDRELMTCGCCHREMPPRAKPGGVPKRYCSRICAARFRARGADDLGRICVRCAQPIPRTRRSSAKHCSDECARKALARRGYLAKRDQIANQHRIRRFGVDDQRLAEMLAAQGGGCAICGKTEPGGRGDWHVDHDHTCCSGRKTCGQCVRGVLCAACNWMLGSARDNADVLMAAAAYVLTTRDLLTVRT